MREHVAGGLSFLDLVAELPSGTVVDDGHVSEVRGRTPSRRRVSPNKARQARPPDGRNARAAK
jgi:hypothetical protein